MKPILLTLVATCALLASCKDTKKGQKLDPYASITLNGTTVVPTASAVSVSKLPPAPPYSIRTITKYAFDMSYKSTDPSYTGYSRGFMERDVEAGKLKVGQMSDVVDVDRDGNPRLGWIVTSDIHDVVLRATYKYNDETNWANPEGGDGGDGFSFKKDTIGYAPNAVVQRAEGAIRTAFDAGDYEECMRLFESAYVFIPTTGAQWRALKAAGIE